MKPGDKYRDKITGYNIRVIDVERTRVKILDESGNISWIADTDFAVRFRPIARLTTR